MRRLKSVNGATRTTFREIACLPKQIASETSARIRWSSARAEFLTETPLHRARRRPAPRSFYDSRLAGDTELAI
jgi:hypothetical protein